MSATRTKDMTPADVLKLVRSGVSDEQLDAISQQVLLMRTDSGSLNALRGELANLNRDKKKFAKASALFRAIANGETDSDAEARFQEVMCLNAAGQSVIALKALELVPKHKKSDFRFHEFKGIAHERLGQFGRAIECYKSVLASGKIRSSTLQLLIGVLQKEDRFEEAKKILQDVLSSYPDRAEFHYFFSQTLFRTNHIKEAILAARQAVDLEPGNAGFLFFLATCVQVRGSIKEAEALTNQALDIEPHSPSGLAFFGKVHKYKAGSYELSRLEQAVSRMHLCNLSDRVNLLHAKASSLEDLKDYPAAFAYHKAAGELKLTSQVFDPNENYEFRKKIQRAFTPEYIAADRSDRCQSYSPVFVLGMPRSGTSLLEQVLSSHSEVAGIGEQKIISRVIDGMNINDTFQLETSAQSYFDQVSNVSPFDRGNKYIIEAAKVANTNYSRTVDKMPSNYSHLGVILDILPNAHIIHSMRHPIETCLSCYRIIFAEGHTWSYDLTHLGKHYRKYFELMCLWNEIFGERILHVRYEDMVENLEQQARKMFDFMELDFEEGCLNFHNNPNPMRTASVLQVRKPLYRSSLDRWREHKEIYAPLYEEIQDIVDLYEKKNGLFALPNI